MVDDEFEFAAFEFDGVVAGAEFHCSAIHARLLVYVCPVRANHFVVALVEFWAQLAVY